MKKILDELMVAKETTAVFEWKDDLGMFEYESKAERNEQEQESERAEVIAEKNYDTLVDALSLNSEEKLITYTTFSATVSRWLMLSIKMWKNICLGLLRINMKQKCITTKNILQS